MVASALLCKNLNLLEVILCLKETGKRLIIQTGKEEALIGRAFFFVRLNNEKPITTRNLADMLFNQIDATSNGVLGGVAELMKVYFQLGVKL